MKKEKLFNMIQMLTMQLNEEEVDYSEVLMDKRKLKELKKIQQRIIALK